MSDKPKFPFAQAHAVAERIVLALSPACRQIQIAGSLRRHEKTVGDIELVYVPKMEEGRAPGELVPSLIDLSIDQIQDLEAAGVLERRQNVNGVDTFGPRNKLMRHCQSGIPVDLFATDDRSWWNYFTCRTGPAAFNIRVAQRARELGWKWHPYDCGFSRERVAGVVEWFVIRSEEQFFEFLGWPFQQPSERKSVEPGYGMGVEAARACDTGDLKHAGRSLAKLSTRKGGEARQNLSDAIE